MIVWDGCDSSFVEKVRRVEFEMPELAAESVPFLSFSILIFHDFHEKTKIESDLFICYSNHIVYVHLWS